MTTDRKTTKWKPGQTGNPKGRPPGQSAITRLRASLAGDVPEILAGLVMAAKVGDVQAARLILERIRVAAGYRGGVLSLLPTLTRPVLYQRVHARELTIGGDTLMG